MRTWGVLPVEKLRHDYTSDDGPPLQKGFHGVLSSGGGEYPCHHSLFAIEAFIVRLYYTRPLHQHVVSGAYNNHSLGFTTLSFIPQGPFRYDTLYGSVRLGLARSVPKTRHPTEKPGKSQKLSGLQLFFDNQKIRQRS